MEAVAAIRHEVLMAEAALEDQLWETSDARRAGRLDQCIRLCDQVLEDLTDLSTESIASALKALAYMMDVLNN